MRNRLLSHFASKLTKITCVKEIQTSIVEHITDQFQLFRCQKKPIEWEYDIYQKFASKQSFLRERLIVENQFTSVICCSLDSYDTMYTCHYCVKQDNLNKFSNQIAKSFLYSDDQILASNIKPYQVIQHTAILLSVKAINTQL